MSTTGNPCLALPNDLPQGEDPTPKYGRTNVYGPIEGQNGPEFAKVGLVMPTRPQRQPLVLVPMLRAPQFLRKRSIVGLWTSTAGLLAALIEI
jgi:hypothetical protein